MNNNLNGVFEKLEIRENNYLFLYKKGMDCFHNKDFRNAEFYLEKAAKDPFIPAKMKTSLKKFLNRREFNNLHNSCGPVAYRASHMTCGGNYASGGWSPYNGKSC